VSQLRSVLDAPLRYSGKDWIGVAVTSAVIALVCYLFVFIGIEAWSGKAIVLGIGIALTLFTGYSFALAADTRRVGGPRPTTIRLMFDSTPKIAAIALALVVVAAGAIASVPLASEEKTQALSDAPSLVRGPVLLSDDFRTDHRWPAVDQPEVQARVTPSGYAISAAGGASERYVIAPLPSGTAPDAVELSISVHLKTLRTGGGWGIGVVCLHQAATANARAQQISVLKLSDGESIVERWNQGEGTVDARVDGAAPSEGFHLTVRCIREGRLIAIGISDDDVSFRWVTTSGGAVGEPGSVGIAFGQPGPSTLQATISSFTARALVAAR